MDNPKTGYPSRKLLCKLQEKIMYPISPKRKQINLRINIFFGIDFNFAIMSLPPIKE